jgi:hypothetical protein
MRTKSKKNSKCDLLEMSCSERIQLIRRIREQLRQKAIEARLWQSLQEAENVTINGKAIVQDREPLTRFYLRNNLRYR